MKKSYLLILIVLALLLGTARPGNRATPSHQRDAGQIEQTASAEQTYSAPIATVSDQTSPTSTGTQSTAYPYNYYYPAQETWLTFVGQIATIASAVLLTGFTGGLWITSIRQWRAIKRQAKIAEQAAKDGRDALRLEQRPWLVPTGDAQLGMPNGKIPEGNQIPMGFDLKNTGNTPALQVTVRWTYDVKTWDDPMPEDEVSSQHIFILGAIGPGVPRRIPLDLGPFSPPTRDEILDGTYRLTVRGYVEYRGHANMPEPKPYTIKFCLTWFPLGSTAEHHFVVFGPYNDCT